MCDNVKTVSVEQPPQMDSGCSAMYAPNGRRDLEDCIKGLRDRADKLEALLKSIPEAITPEAQQGLQYISSMFWRVY